MIRCFRRSSTAYTAQGVPHFGKETPATFDRGWRNDGDGVFQLRLLGVPEQRGDIEGIFVVASDVTEQVVARQLVDGLREAAESANRAKDEFLAMLGHELRNPLAPILTALQLMQLRGDAGIRARARRSSSARSATWCGWSTTCSTSRGSRAARSSCKTRARRARRGGREGDRDGQPAPRAASAHA